jgi:hypothetical protein
MNLMKITSHIIILACLASATALAVSSQATAPDFADIDAYVVAQMKDLRIPGLVLAIVQGDQIVHLKAFGVADPSGRAVTPQTPFILGSLNRTTGLQRQVTHRCLSVPLPLCHRRTVRSGASLNSRDLPKKTAGFGNPDFGIAAGDAVRALSLPRPTW